MNISLYPRIRVTVPVRSIPIDLFLDGIKDGQWQDEVLRVRVIKDKDLRQEEKKSIPYVTISGEFSERNLQGLLQHSGLLAIDLDDIDVNEVKSRICCDPHVYACFMSISATGLCVVFKINPDRHLDSFLGLQEYLFTTYQLVVDIQCKDVSRARFVSWDPDIFINEDARKFTKYPKKDTRQIPVREVVYVQADFDHIIEQIAQRRIDITGGYHQWLKCCFALCDKLGEHGRGYFHTISQFSPLYEPQLADRQYSNCLKAGRSGITIASFYYLAKEHGVIIASERTRIISQTALLAKKGGRTKESVAKLLSEVEDIPPGDSEPIIDQVFDHGAEGAEEESVVEQVRIWLFQNYDLRFNEVTGLNENKGIPLTDRQFLAIELDMKKSFPKHEFAVITKMLKSDYIPSYHPIKDFFSKYQGIRRPGIMQEFWGAIDSPTGWPGYVEYFGTKWLVGLIAGVYGHVSPLMFILCGEKVGTGKSKFFQNLLPPELRPYETIKSLADMASDTARRDLEIAMSRYLLIWDDEMGGKSKRDEKKIKALLSLPSSTHRAAFGHVEERRIRMCGFGGTSNDLKVIGWDVGPQRRLVPAEVVKIDYARINAISRIELIMEAYGLFRDGFDYQVLGDDVERLHEATEKYQQINGEAELCLRMIRKPEAGDVGVTMTLTEIKNYLQGTSKDVLNIAKVSKCLTDMHIYSELKRVQGQPLRVYQVVKLF
jgi:hypothetical protein